MEKATRRDWHAQHAELLEHARQMKAQPVVDRDELIALQQEIRDLERRIDRPLPPGTEAIRYIPGPQEERPGRAPGATSTSEQRERRCAFGRCDGSGWHLNEDDLASPCECQRLPRDREARRQSKRVLRRHLALGLDAPPLSNLALEIQSALRSFNADLASSVREGHGLWFVGESTEVSAPCAFLAGEALRRAIPVLLYPGDELIGRLRRLAADSAAALDDEIFGRLSAIDLLVVDGLDEAAAPARFPEVAPPETTEDQPTDAMLGQGRVLDAEGYRPGMTDVDLSRLALILNERLINKKATILSTRFSRPLLEEDLLRLPGSWPSGEGRRWDEPTRRAQQLRLLFSRFHELCGSPLPARDGVSPVGSVRSVGQASAGDASPLRTALLSSN
jgi:hypothetical protein